jgi:hypothetical protein
MIQDPAVFTFNCDIIAQILPLEDGRLTLNLSTTVFCGVISVRWCSSTGFIVVGDLGLMAASENKNLAFRASFGNEFGSGQVHEHEKDHERDHNSQIPPEMRVVVLIARSQVRVTVDAHLTRAGRDSVADGILWVDILIAWAGWDEGHAGKLAVVELVDHQ